MNSPVPLNSPHKGQWCGALMCFFYLRLNKQFSKQSLGWWFETPWWSLWPQCNEIIPSVTLKLLLLFANIPHSSDVIMSAITSQITGISIVYSTVCSGAGQRKHQSSVSLAFMRGIHRWPLNSLHKGPVTRKMFPFDDGIMNLNWVITAAVDALAPADTEETKQRYCVLSPVLRLSVILNNIKLLVQNVKFDHSEKQWFKIAGFNNFNQLIQYYMIALSTVLWPSNYFSLRFSNRCVPWCQVPANDKVNNPLGHCTLQSVSPVNIALT